MTRLESPRDSRRRRGHARLVGAALILGAAFLACVGRWEPPGETGYRRTESVAEAGARIGSQECLSCHASFEGHFMASEAHSDCESCHGPAQGHAYDPQTANIRYPGNADCAACHQVGSRTLLDWSTSVHARSNVLCSDCHNTHNRELHYLREPDALQTAVLPRASSTTRMCGGCHADVVAQLGLPSHHPVAEGALDCSDCHDPHGNSALTRGTRTQACTSCHQEVMGPWIYEHAPVTEDCGYCHVPHGATADFLLEANQPATCISCHSIATAGAIHQPYAFSSRCTDCHSAVHGSHADPVLRR